MSHWYDRAKHRMRERGITQENLMPIFGVKTRGAVGHYLTGRRDPPTTSLVMLADMLGMSLDELLRDPPPQESQRRRVLLENYDAADDAGKREIEKSCAAVAKPQKQKVKRAS